MTHAGPYALLKRLSSGTTGEVFVACRDGDRAHPVAVKLMLPHLAGDPAVTARFLDEARNASRMRHPNVVQIIDLGLASDGRPWLALDLVEGVSLWTLLERCRARGELLPLPIVRRLAQGLCDGLEYAHAVVGPDGLGLHLVHRDVSPSNVLLSTDGEVRLTDFGLARAVGNLAKTSPGGLGTLKLGYSAPELALGSAPVDRRADVFSAGVTLYEAATLAHPFRSAGASDAETLAALARGAATHPSDLRPELSRTAGDALMRALAHVPAARPSTAAVLRGPLLDGEVAGPEALGLLVRRHCPEELARFFALDDVQDDQPDVPTLTVHIPSVVTPAPRPPARWPTAAALAFVAAAGVIAFVSSRVREPQVEIVDIAELEPIDAGAEHLNLPPLDVSSRAVGWLTLEGVGSAQVYLDGIRLNPPFDEIEVPAGKHVLLLRGKRNRVERKVTVAEGARVVVQLKR